MLGDLTAGLLGFNLGIEAAQLIAVALVMPAALALTAATTLAVRPFLPSSCAKQVAPSPRSDTIGATGRPTRPQAGD